MKQVRSNSRIPSRSTLAIVGAGPIGLEAAALAALRDWDVLVFEKGRVGEHIRKWGHVQLFSPFGMNHSDWSPALLSRTFSQLDLPSESAYLTGLEYVKRYLEPLAALPQLRERIFLNTQVLQIGKEGLSKHDWIGEKKRLHAPFRILIRQNGREKIHRTHAVIDASGVYSSPRFLGSGNIPAPGELEARCKAPSHLHYGLVDLLGKAREHFEQRKVLLIGAGYSAATALEAFSQLAHCAPRTKVFWVHRSTRIEPFPLFENDPLPYRDQLGGLGNRLAASVPTWLTSFPGSSVEKIRFNPKDSQHRFEVFVGGPQESTRLEVDQILAHVGFVPDNSLHRQLQVHECYATGGPIKLAASLLGGSADCLAQESHGIDVLQNPEPNFFILGNKSYGTNSTFLIKHGIEQVSTVMDHLAETGELNDE